MLHLVFFFLPYFSRGVQYAPRRNKLKKNNGKQSNEQLGFVR